MTSALSFVNFEALLDLISWAPNVFRGDSTFEMRSTFKGHNPHYRAGAKGSERSNLAVPLIGFTLVVLGSVGIIRTFLSPFSLPGGLLYLLIGLIISMISSKNFRLFCVSCLPLELASILFEKSLLDILTETSAIAKCYTLIGMIPVLRSEEIHSLSETLPPECAFLRKKGLVHLLPSPFGDIFDNDRNERYNPPRRGEFPYSDNGVANENDRDLNSYHSFFSVPHLAQAVSNPATTSTSTSPISRNIVVSTYPNVRSARSVITQQIRSAGNVIRQGTHLNSNFGRRNLPHLHLPTRSGVSGLSIPQGDFERTLEQMIARRTEVTTNWVVQKISSAVSSTVYRLASGGHMSDKFMIGLIGACSAGAGIASVAYQALQASTNNHEIVVRGSGSITAAQKAGYVLQLALRNAAMCATPCLGTVAIATGSMFAVRKVSNASLTVFSHLRIREILARSRNFLWRLQVSPLRCFSLGKFFNLNDPTFLIVVSAWTLTAFLALQLKVRTKNFKWMFNIILARLLRSYEELFNLDENCNV